ncbi:3-oxoadipate enol-lactonase [Microvirga zambiensis]|uniref:3-oxoadipate enol-lactonase n=1 Tax=Microvirga zambiensis TaxID=1402137 RepID=UPI00191DC6FB|nr:3-oxoadipate enol-lactonase [Microvirga zambiensis]
MKADVNGISINYSTKGEAGDWVVLSHSLSGSLEAWAPQIEELSATFRVLVYDIRGHGQSDAPQGPYTMDLLADDLEALLDHLKIDRAHLVGLSLGGAIAQTLAVRRPGRLLSLTIADATSAYPPSTHAMWEGRINQVETQGIQSIVGGTLDRWFTPAFRAHDPQTVDAVGNIIRATSPTGFIGAVGAIMGFDISSKLFGVQIPTLVLVGEEDKALPVEHSRFIADSIPGARLEIIPAAAHISNLEQPTDFSRRLINFLECIR